MMKCAILFPKYIVPDDDDDEYQCKMYTCSPLYGIGVIVAVIATALLVAGIVLSTQNG